MVKNSNLFINGKNGNNASKNIDLNRIVMNTIFISIIYNVFVLGYLLNLEDDDCNCFRDWRHDFMKYYSIVLIVWGLINLSFNLYNSKNTFILMINNISMIAFFINIWCLYSYVGILDYTKCLCAINKSKIIHYFLYLFRYVIIALIFVSLFAAIIKTIKKK
jgi:hypothetical protein